MQFEDNETEPLNAFKGKKRVGAVNETNDQTYEQETNLEGSSR
jgi:hypothetical protein